MNDLISKLTGLNWSEFWQSLEFGTELHLSWIAGLAAMILLSMWIYRRDAAKLHPAVRVTLVTLRLLVLLTLLLIAMSPQERKSRLVSQRSRVAVLVDTSMSMSLPATDLAADTVADSIRSRASEVEQTLASGPLLSELTSKHDVVVYTFDSTATAAGVLPYYQQAGDEAASGDAAGNSEPSNGLPAGDPSTTDGAPDAATANATEINQIANNPSGNSDPSKINWKELTRPRGAETGLGESLVEVLRREAGETLAGVVVFTDGLANAGLDPRTIADTAAESRPPLVLVGVGGERRPVNLRLADVQAPSLVQLGDRFAIAGFVIGQGLANERVIVELVRLGDDAAAVPTVLESRDVTLLEDGIPAAVSFEVNPAVAGRMRLSLRTRLVRPVTESFTEDNQSQFEVEVIDRKVRVLLLASGPMRDYQFVRNLLFRDRGIELDVILQTSNSGASQESNRLLSQFPATREELFRYDVIVAFDPNWRLIQEQSPQAFELLADWVFGQAGGLVLIAGDVHTPQLASRTGPERTAAERLLALYPVGLEPAVVELDEEFRQPWAVELTQEGRDAAFMQLTDNPSTSAAAWKEFSGVYRCYPTDGIKSAATLYANSSDPRYSGQKPALIVSQFYGAGRVFYLGCGEWWLLRSLDEDYFDRFWIKMLRDAGQGRLLRGTNRGLILLESKQVSLGSSVQIRARVLDPQFAPLTLPAVPMQITTPVGRPLQPQVSLTADKSRAGNYIGALVAAQPGVYQLELPIPNSDEVARESITVRLPNLEYDRQEQDVALMRTLAQSWPGSGTYLPMSSSNEIPKLLPDRTIERRQFETPRPLWDQQGMMFWLVSLLGLEWLTRKLSRLA